MCVCSAPWEYIIAIYIYICASEQVVFIYSCAKALARAPISDRRVSFGGLYSAGRPYTDAIMDCGTRGAIYIGAINDEIESRELGIYTFMRIHTDGILLDKK